MKFSINILSDKFLKGMLPLNWQEFVVLFAKCGHEIGNLSIKKYSAEKLDFDGDTIIFAENKNIDQLIVENINSLSNDKEIVEDLGVIFNVQEKHVIFLPIDVNFHNLLEKVLKKLKKGLKTSIFHVFGKTNEQIEDLLKPVEDVKIDIIENNLLSDVYVTYEGDENLIDDTQVQIAGLLRENLFSENELNLSSSVCTLLNLKNAKIAICEGVTYGNIMSLLGRNSNFANCLKEGKIDFDQNPDGEKIYTKAYRYLKESLADVVLVIDGKFDDKGLNSIIAVGDKNTIGIYKNRFNACREQAIEMASNCALYHLLKKLRQNDFAF